MFATLIYDLEVIDGVVLCYNNPDVLIPKKETWPPSAALRDDIEKYAFHKKLPSVTFVSFMQKDNAPLVIEGYVFAEHGNFKIMSSVGDRFPLQFEKFQAENDELMDKRNNRTFLPVMLYAADSPKCKVVWKPFRDFRYSYSGKDCVQSWIGGLILLYAAATKELLRIILKPRSDIRAELAIHKPLPAKDTSNTGMYWIWWSCSKPGNLAEWVRHCWENDWDFDTMQLVLREYHPMNSGFYRIWLTDSLQEGDVWSVVVMWMTNTELQYKVSILQGVDDSSLPFGPDGSHRAVLAIQNKTVLPFFNGEEPQGRWEMAERFQKQLAYIASHTKGMPCEFSPCFTQSSPTQDEIITRWKSWRIGSGEDLGPGLRNRFDTEADIGLTQLWRRND